MRQGEARNGWATFNLGARQRQARDFSTASVTPVTPSSAPGMHFYAWRTLFISTKACLASDLRRVSSRSPKSTGALI